MFLATLPNLLIVGIVAQKMANDETCTAYSVAHAYGISHVTARKRLARLEAKDLLERETTITRRGFERVQYTVSGYGFDFLRKNLKLYTDAYLEMLFSKEKPF